MEFFEDWQHCTTMNLEASGRNLTRSNFLSGQSEIKDFVCTYLANGNLQVLYKQIKNLDHSLRQQYFKFIASRDKDFQSIYIKPLGFYKLNKYRRSILFRFDPVKKCFTLNSG